MKQLHSCETIYSFDIPTSFFEQSFVILRSTADASFFSKKLCDEGSWATRRVGILNPPDKNCSLTIDWRVKDLVRSTISTLMLTHRTRSFAASFYAMSLSDGGPGYLQYGAAVVLRSWWCCWENSATTAAPQDDKGLTKFIKSSYLLFEISQEY